MKENKFRTILSKVNPDASMDQRITDHLINYQELSETKDMVNKCNKQTFSLLFHQRLPLLNNISKAAAAIVLLTILGTATVWAGGHFVKSYPIDMQIEQAEDLENYYENAPKPEKTTVLHFGEYEIRNTVYKDADGNIIEPDENGNFLDEDGNVIAYGDENDRAIDSYKNYDPTKGGNKVFELLGLPNIIPTYLYENYTLDPGGYTYKEEEFTDHITKQIEAIFFYASYQKSVYISYRPVNDVDNLNESLYITDKDVSDFEKTTYITKTGLLFNILYEKDNNNLTSAEIHFTSDTIGDGIYSISFNRIEMDEIKVILDSIPISSTE